MNYFNAWDDWFRARNERERWLMVVGVIVFLFLAWLFFWYQPWLQKINALTSDIDRAQKSVNTLQAIDDNYQLVIRSPTQAIENKIQSLQTQLLQLQHHPLLIKKLVSTSDDLREVSQDISKTDPKISLSQMQHVSTTAVTTSKQIPLANQKFLMEFTGGYFDTVHYLDYLEKLPWYLSFDSLEYQVTDYPNAKITVVMNTLGMTEGMRHD